MTDKERMYANPLDWKLMVARNTGHTVVTYDELSGLVEIIDRQQAEIERKDEKIEELAEVLSNSIRIRYAEARAEAIKEFASRLRRKAYMPFIFAERIGLWVAIEDINEIEKEMTEGNK